MPLLVEMVVAVARPQLALRAAGGSSLIEWFGGQSRVEVKYMTMSHGWGRGRDVGGEIGAGEI